MSSKEKKEESSRKEPELTAAGGRDLRSLRLWHRSSVPIYIEFGEERLLFLGRLLSFSRPHTFNHSSQLNKRTQEVLEALA